MYCSNSSSSMIFLACTSSLNKTLNNMILSCYGNFMQYLHYMNFFATKIMKGKGLLYLNIHTTYICASSMTIRHHLTQGSGAGIAMNLFGFRNPKKYFKIV